ncbi:MAG: hypothetical protein ACREDC_08735 [Bradyrhizobium sp.]
MAARRQGQMIRAGLRSRKAADRDISPRPLYPSDLGGPPSDRVIEVADQLKPYVQQVVAASNLAPFRLEDLVRPNRHADRLEEDAEESVATPMMRHSRARIERGCADTLSCRFWTSILLLAPREIIASCENWASRSEAALSQG